jgi:heme A synthase
MIQKRPIGGGTGAPIAIAIAGTVVHTLDASAVKNGGPYMDEVTLFLHNITAFAAVATVAVTGGSSILVTVAARSILLVLDEEPYRLSGGTITVSGGGQGSDFVAWGWFTRS